jgi:hypothetical protein
MGEEADSPPPIFRTWRRFYFVVIVNTLLVYGLLLLFSAFAR